MSYPSTFVDIQNAVLQKGRLNSSDDLTKVKDWINQAYYESVLETEFFEAGTASAALTAGATSVTVPAAILSIDYIVPSTSDGAQWGPMDMITFEELLENRAWSAGAVPLGAPTRYSYRSASASTIEIWPNANGGETLTFYGNCLPTALASDGDIPIFPEPYATKVLEYGALSQVAEFKKDIFFLQQNQQLYAMWQGKLRSFINTRVGDKVQQFRVEKQRHYPRGNSVDTGGY